MNDSLLNLIFGLIWLLPSAPALFCQLSNLRKAHFDADVWERAGAESPLEVTRQSRRNLRTQRYLFRTTLVAALVGLLIVLPPLLNIEVQQTHPIGLAPTVVYWFSVAGIFALLYLIDAMCILEWRDRRR